MSKKSKQRKQRKAECRGLPGFAHSFALAQGTGAAQQEVQERIQRGGANYLQDNFIRIMIDSHKLRREPEFRDLYFDLEQTADVSSRVMSQHESKLRELVKKSKEGRQTYYDEVRIEMIDELATPAFRQDVLRRLHDLAMRLATGKDADKFEMALVLQPILQEKEIPWGLCGLITTIYEESADRAAQEFRQGLEEFETLFKSANQASLTFATGGRLKELPVAEGTRVKAGALLAALDTSVLEAQVAQAKAAFDLATANWNKIQAGPSADDIALAKSNVDRAKAAVDQAQAAYDAIGGLRNPRIAMTSQSTNLQQATLSYQTAAAQYNLAVNHPTDAERAIGLAQFAQAQAAYDTAKQSLNNARIVAPYDGTLVSITPKIGESINANSPVLLFADLTQMQVLANIDETTLASIQVGQTANIYIDAVPDKALTGRVKRIGMYATSTGNIVTVPVWIDIDKTDVALSPGWSATVEIATRGT